MDAVFLSQRTCRRARRTGCAVRGFTLVELIIVLVLLGVLAVVAAPRIFNTGDFNSRGFHDETLGLLRYAQKTAIAQRRTVCVSFPGGNSALLRIASASAVTSCDVDLIGPKGQTPGKITAKSGVAYSTAPLTVHFDGLGQPLNASSGLALSAARTIQVTGAANAITIEPGTGYVHE